MNDSIVRIYVFVSFLQVVQRVINSLNLLDDTPKGIGCCTHGQTGVHSLSRQWRSTEVQLSYSIP